MKTDWQLTSHTINGVTFAIRYLGGGEWAVGKEKVMFSGSKAELVESIARRPKEHLLRWAK